MKKTNTLPLETAVDSDYKLHLVRGVEDRLEKMGLYQVVASMSRMNGNSLWGPVLSTYMVIAESENGAISQVDDLAAGGGVLSGTEARAAGVLIMTATRVPLYLRGWGKTTV